MVGCGCLVVLVVLVGVGLLFVPKMAWEMLPAGLGKALSAARAERDRLLAEALANGDARTAYERADERFRRAYTAEQLAAYFRDQPALFDPPRDSVSFSNRAINGKTIVSTTFETRQRKYTIYAAKDGVLHLLGISPALDRAVPPENRESEGASTKASTNGLSPKGTL
jgi:hypothetical protein